MVSERNILPIDRKKNPIQLTMNLHISSQLLYHRNARSSVFSQKLFECFAFSQFYDMIQRNTDFLRFCYSAALAVFYASSAGTLILATCKNIGESPIPLAQAAYDKLKL